jgi:hypothetical protein
MRSGGVPRREYGFQRPPAPRDVMKVSVVEEGDGVAEGDERQQEGKISEMIVTEAWILSDWRMRSAVVSPMTPAPMTTTRCLAGEDIFILHLSF